MKCTACTTNTRGLVRAYPEHLCFQPCRWHPHLEGVAVLLRDRHAWVGGPHMRKHQRRGDLARQPAQVLIVPASRVQLYRYLHRDLQLMPVHERCLHWVHADHVLDQRVGQAYQAGVMEVKVHGVGSARGVAPSGLNHPMPKPSPAGRQSHHDAAAGRGRCVQHKCGRLDSRMLTVEIPVRQVLRQRCIHDAFPCVI